MTWEEKAYRDVISLLERSGVCMPVGVRILSKRITSFRFVNERCNKCGVQEACDELGVTLKNLKVFKHSFQRI